MENMGSILSFIPKLEAKFISGSASIANTECFSDNIQAKVLDIVVFPTPPFPVIAIFIFSLFYLIIIFTNFLLLSSNKYL
ncbi:hypothetical protein [uncultured Methanobrevibacter sp.]|uniref:hypothetical protein n=1 Tax=uncultured Methanobrevibacter sp. TaxID=253161 RepID=UPI0026203523|nr:hypothetical protein [uncultured Methanobrevibacter sp.]